MESGYLSIFIFTCKSKDKTISIGYVFLELVIQSCEFVKPPPPHFPQVERIRIPIRISQHFIVSANSIPIQPTRL